MTKKKRPSEQPTEKAIKKLFPKPVIDRVKKEAREGGKKKVTPDSRKEG